MCYKCQLLKNVSIEKTLELVKEDKYIYKSDEIMTVVSVLKCHLNKTETMFIVKC